MKQKQTPLINESKISIEVLERPNYTRSNVTPEKGIFVINADTEMQRTVVLVGKAAGCRIHVGNYSQIAGIHCR